MNKGVKSPENLLKFFSDPGDIFPKECSMEDIEKLSQERINTLRSADEKFVRGYLNGFYRIINTKMQHRRPGRDHLSTPENLSKGEILGLIDAIENHYIRILKSKNGNILLNELVTLTMTNADRYRNYAEATHSIPRMERGLGHHEALPLFNQFALELIGHNLSGSTMRNEGAHLYPLARRPKKRVLPVRRLR